MASLISQMRNGTQLQPQQQMQLQNNVAQIRGLMQQAKMASNPSQFLLNYIQQNPQYAQVIKMLTNGANPQQLAQQMARERGIDLNALIAQLGGQ